MPDHTGERTWTVYFDASFWIRLARLADADGSAIVSDLNALGVRYVISKTLLDELLLSSRRPDLDHAIEARSRLFTLPPLDLTPALGFKLLIAPEPMRSALARFLRSIDDVGARAASLSLIADTPAAAEVAAAGHLDPAADWEVLGGFVGALTGIEVPTFDALSSSDPARLEELQERLRAAVPASGLREVEERSATRKSVAENDVKPKRIAMGDDDMKTLASAGGMYRDADHMGTFASHADKIDFLHIDGPRQNQLASKASHALRARGLAERCFAAATPAAAVDRLRELIAMRQ